MKAIFAYIPVVHKGVIDFLNEYKGVPVFILDNEEGKKENVYLERDIRALSAMLIRTELLAHGYTSIEVVKPVDLPKFLAGVSELIIPEDEIVEYFVKKYVSNISYTKINTFLRWTKQISTKEFEVPPDRIVSVETFSKDMIKNLKLEANKSPDWWRQIAAAIVRDGEVIAEAINSHYPTSHSLSINGDPRSNLDAGQGPCIYTSIHAEACALARAAKKGLSVDGADIFVTTFPCPACARSLVEAGIKRVYYNKGYSSLDAEEILRNAGVEIILVEE